MKNSLKILSILSFAFMLNLGLLFNFGSSSSILNESLQAQTLGGGSEPQCDGGSCSFTTYFNGEPTEGCSACCPQGKSPTCSTHGCFCTID